MDKKILIVDDEEAIREMLAVALELEGYSCIMAATALDGEQAIKAEQPDVILLDWMLPNNMSGIDLCKKLKAQTATKNIPIIMLSALGEVDNKVTGLDAGADDYLSKPFSIKELLSRVRSVIRRSSNDNNNSEVLKVDSLQIDLAGKRVSVESQQIAVGPTEYRLLEFFMKNQERAYTRLQLLDHVWGMDVYVEDRTVDVHIRRLRKILTPFGYDKNIETVRGTGYRFTAKNNL